MKEDIPSNSSYGDAGAKPYLTDFLKTIGSTPAILLRHDLCKSSGDPKLDGGLPPVYVPEQDYEAALQSLSNLSQARLLNVSFDQGKFYGADADHGLLYLPFPYLVPGGRFNEMYGWDTAFPIFAWTREHPRLMREQIDNQLYQIRMYGKVLNANRTYYLSRSQPPLLSAMVMHLWKDSMTRDWRDFDPDGLYKNSIHWLASAYQDLTSFYSYWTSGDRLAGDTGLSRYWDDSSAAAPEVIASEEGHFHHAREFYAHSAITGDDQEDAGLFYDRATDTLTPLYHRANRAMRASGFDPTGHWGYGALRCMFHAPVCLNSLLYGMESDMVDFASILLLRKDRDTWIGRRDGRKTRMRALMFNAETGAYHGYDFVRQRQNVKPFASIFYPLWAGLYDPETEKEDMEKMTGYALGQLETNFGISTSTEISGSQWDHPYGWPPLQYFAFEGLRRAGLIGDAARIAGKYITLVEKVFATHRSLFEKYDVVRGNAEIHVVNGYHENASERGTFLWTAAVATLAQDLLDTCQPSS